MADWSIWLSFPKPESIKNIAAPSGPGVYQLRHKSTGEYILFGIGGECQKRMKSLMPKPYGTGTRNNSFKREYVLKHYSDIEYRTLSTNTREKASEIEKKIKQEFNYKFNT